MYNYTIGNIHFVELITTIQKAYSCESSTNASVVETVYDIHSWLKPHIPPLHDHLKAHQFKFEKISGHACMFYKEWSSEPHWLPSNGLEIYAPAKLKKVLGSPVLLLEWNFSPYSHYTTCAFAPVPK